MKMNDGGPAFPQCSVLVPPLGAFVSAPANEMGMSLRDWFAGKAMQGDLASYSTNESAEAAAKLAVEEGLDSLQYVARTAYDIADAMIAERANVGQPLPETKWLIWSNEHDAWWGPNSCGYTKDRARAGHYTFAEALEIVTGANVHHDSAHETMCPVWAPL